MGSVMFSVFTVCAVINIGYRVRIMGFVFTMSSVSGMFAMLHTVDHRARTHEQQRLKEGVRNQVKSGSRVCANAQGCDHKSELADGRISQYLLDVVLRNRNCGGK